MTSFRPWVQEHVKQLIEKERAEIHSADAFFQDALSFFGLVSRSH